MIRYRSARARQGGVVILTLILIVFSASTFVLLKALNAAAARQTEHRMTTKHALMLAKRALIGYAINYADGSHALDKGPGHLPCPDRSSGSDPGIAESECSVTSDAETGRLPFRTLGLAEVTDGSGAGLWYAVSDNHRSQFAPPLNSETAGTLEVDGKGDVVAVIIAPGAALAGQSRTSANTYDAAAWLEDDNASIGDSDFVSAAGSEFNDSVLTITRGELMAEVEKMVIRETANALESYFQDPDGDDDADGNDPDCGADADCDDGFPWLADADEDPSTSAYAGTVDDFASGDFSAGRLPLTRSGVAFAANFAANWDVGTAGVYVPSGSEPPSEDCMRHSDCIQTYADVPSSANVEFAGGVSGSPSASWSQGLCSWTRIQVVTLRPLHLDCVATHEFSTPAGTRNLRRVYRLELTGNTSLQAPTTTARRSVRVYAAGSWSGDAATLTITDYELPAENEIGSATLSFTALNGGDVIDLAGVPFELEVSNDQVVEHDVSPGELPSWFFANRWQELVLVQYARAESAGDTYASCVDVPGGASCISVSLQRPGQPAGTIADVRGVVLSAGAGLVGAARPSAARADYFEGINETPSASAERRDISATFNDQIVLLLDP